MGARREAYAPTLPHPRATSSAESALVLHLGRTAMSHTKTGEWKSFEIRMRHRRAERLVLRAEAAADAGRIEDARACLTEARALAPSLGGIAAVEARLDHPPQP